LVKPAWVTYLLLALNVLAFGVQFTDPGVVYRFSAIPVEITSGRDLVGPVEVTVNGDAEPVTIEHGPGPWPLALTLLTAMFLHGDLLHLGGNLLFLWIFGNNVEHRFGPWRFLVFYLGSGLAGGLAHALLDPTSELPMLGASGAISGVLGAYLVLFPRNQVRALLFVWIFSVPAFVVIGLWIGIQALGGVGMLADMLERGGSMAGGVSYAAHLGGAAAGIILGLIYRMRMGEEPETVFTRRVLPPPLPGAKS
jgi:membrane associated rhomboid family serine protease